MEAITKIFKNKFDNSKPSNALRNFFLRISVNVFWGRVCTPSTGPVLFSFANNLLQHTPFKAVIINLSFYNYPRSVNGSKILTKKYY